MNTVEQITKHFEEQRKGLLAIAKREVGEFWYEDCVQEAYLRCLQYKNPKPILEIDYYLKFILSTVIRDYLQDRVSGGEEVEEWMMESGELADEMRASGVLGEVLGEMEKIDEPYRTALYLTMINGERIERASRITELSEDSIKSYAKRFRKEMREKYSEGEGI